MTLPPPRSTLFPYTTLFRSVILLGRFRLWRVRVIAREAAQEPPRLPDRVCHHRWLRTSGRFELLEALLDRKSTRLNSSHRCISYAVFCLKKKRLLQSSLHLL